MTDGRDPAQGAPASRSTTGSPAGADPAGRYGCRHYAEGDFKAMTKKEVRGVLLEAVMVFNGEAARLAGSGNQRAARLGRKGVRLARSWAEAELGFKLVPPRPNVADIRYTVWLDPSLYRGRLAASVRIMERMHEEFGRDADSGVSQSGLACSYCKRMLEASLGDLAGASRINAAGAGP